MDKSRGAIGGLVFVLGLILGLLGYVGHLYSSGAATLLMLGMWIVGGGLARFVLSDKREPIAWPDGTWPVGHH